ncbi:unnamed protein product [Phytomonas sp. Hart1]|nr:unnamed protein product [Phytomonas sp. Hart1]|eukprot:CCW70838.1 unnamed protein product [Phytomonas sp. isolate Hart1]
MRSNLYGSKVKESPREGDPRGSNKLHVEEQLQRENEALLDALRHGVRRMGAMAGALNAEVGAQNRLLSGLGGGFVRARTGVGTSITNLRGVMGRHGYRQIVYIVLGTLFSLYVLFRLLL